MREIDVGLAGSFKASLAPDYNFPAEPHSSFHFFLLFRRCVQAGYCLLVCICLGRTYVLRNVCIVKRSCYVLGAYL